MSNYLLSINNLSVALPKGADRDFAIKDISLALNSHNITHNFNDLKKIEEIVLKFHS